MGGWDTQTFIVSDLVLSNGYILGGTKISALIRTRLQDAEQYALVYDISVQCVEIETTRDLDTPSPLMPVLSTDHICVSGSSDRYNGEYQIVERLYNGKLIFQSYGGVIYWNSDGSYWALGSDLGVEELRCTTSSSKNNVFYLSDGDVFCIAADENGIAIVGGPTLIQGECEDHPVIEYLMGMDEQTRGLLLLITISALSFIVGLLTCGFIVMVMARKCKVKQNYQCVAEEEMIDF